jgi:hypothetical protein
MQEGTHDITSLYFGYIIVGNHVLVQRNIQDADVWKLF